MQTEVCLSVPRMCTYEDYCFPRVIWSHWHDLSRMPKEIGTMIDVTRKSLANFTCYFLTKNNISDFLDINLFPEIFDREISQLLRLSLLEKYGGVWIDSSMFINSGNEMEWLFSETMKAKSQMVGFRFRRHICPEFIGAPERSFLIEKWKNEFELALLNPHKYVRNACTILRGKVDLENNCHTYFIIDLSLKKVTFENNFLFCENILYLPQSKSHYRVVNECRWQWQCVAKRLQLPSIRDIPFVKVHHQVFDFLRSNRNGRKSRKLKILERKLWKTKRKRK